MVDKCQPDEGPGAERRQLHGDGERLKRAWHCSAAYLAEPDSATGTFTLKTVRASDKTETVIATNVPFGGMTWARTTP